MLYSLTTDDKGELIAKTEKGALPLSEILFRLMEFRKGEPYEYILVSKEGNTRIATTIVPFPIEAVGKDQAKISIVIASSDARTYVCIGEGFAPGESLVFCTKSGDEETIDRVEADKTGKIRLKLYPSTPGKKGGSATLSVLRRSETLNLDFGWGRSAMQIVKGDAKP